MSSFAATPPYSRRGAKAENTLKTPLLIAGGELRHNTTLTLLLNKEEYAKGGRWFYMQTLGLVLLYKEGWLRSSTQVFINKNTKTYNFLFISLFLH
jgi:hypothetical protein